MRLLVFFLFSPILVFSQFNLNEDLDQSCLSDTSYTEASACDSYVWNGDIYTNSGAFYYNGISNTSSLDFGNNCSGFGNSFVDYGDVLEMTGSFTIGAWIYNNGCDYTTIMSKRPGNNPYNGFHLSYEPGGNYDFIIHKNYSFGSKTCLPLYKPVFNSK